MNHGIVFVFVGLGTGVLTGCTGPAAANTPAGNAAANTVMAPASGAKTGPALEKGMTAAQVRSLWGEPAEIKPFKTQDSDTEVWVYRRLAGRRVQQIQTGVREIPAVSPRTGQDTTVKEPIYESETLAITDTVELLLYRGLLIEWKRKFLETRTFD
jgi:hypothetical protein